MVFKVNLCNFKLYFTCYIVFLFMIFNLIKLGSQKCIIINSNNLTNFARNILIKFSDLFILLYFQFNNFVKFWYLFLLKIFKFKKFFL
jgi:hypothetical protein